MLHYKKFLCYLLFFNIIVPLNQRERYLYFIGWILVENTGWKGLEDGRMHYDLCCLKECLDGLPSSELLLSSIQARDQVMQRAYLTFKKSMSTESHVLSYYVNVKSRFCKLFNSLLFCYLYDLNTFNLWTGATFLLGGREEEICTE